RVEQKRSSPLFFFFFSSRRRHTRWPRDWSSDVCSSDLRFWAPARLVNPSRTLSSSRFARSTFVCSGSLSRRSTNSTDGSAAVARSEERRVGKECRCGGGACDGENNMKAGDVLRELEIRM